jgi:penicillin V acylase-like amidase (Ntn superfamily)
MKLIPSRKALIVFLIVQITLIIPIISMVTSNRTLDSCSIFSVSRDGNTFFCNNEDEGLRHGRVWFLPGIEDQHGLILFGYGIYRNVMVPVGGLNDQGLCLDMTAVSETQIQLDPSKPNYEGSYFIDMLRECATVEEAKQWVVSYNLLLLNWQQAHIADSAGDAVVIGLDDNGNLWMTNKSEDYLVSTNFNLAQSEEHHVERYDTMVSMLSIMSELTIDYCQEILQTVSASATMYSYICDQQNGLIFLYSRGDFERVAILNVTDELAAGDHSFDIERLVSQQTTQLSFSDAPGDFAGIIAICCIISCSTLITILKLRKKRN